MSSTPSPLQSTRLENIGFESDGARLEFGGQVVRIKKDLDPASVAALRSFYQSALADYHARPEAPPKPGWFSRLRSWLGRLISPSSSASAKAPAELAAQATEYPDASRAKSTLASSQAAGPAPAPSLSAKTPAVAKASADTSADTASAPVLKAPEPTLRAVFADRGGVHLLWQTPAGTGPAAQVELHHSLDSDLAHRLQDCYGHLDRLGYKIVGLELLRTGPRQPGKVATEAVPEKSPTHPAVIASEAPPKPTEKKERALVMNLHPEILEQPDRALVSPVEDSENKQVLVAPERTLRSLRAATDPARPAGERLTYLRCAAGKSGLKLLDVGLGEGKEQAPARWEDAVRWSQREAEAAASQKKPKPGPEPELNL